MTKHAVVSLAMLCLSTIATADPVHEHPRCTLTRIAGRDVTIDVPPSSNKYGKMSNVTWCRTSVRNVAEKWFAENASCEPKKTTFPFTFTWGVPGKESTFNQTGYCPHR